MTNDEVKLYEKRQAAAHEAGHFVMAFVDSYECHARIWPNENGNEDVKSWGGQCKFLKFYPNLQYDQATFAAGCVAEYFDENDSVSADECAEWIQLFYDELSETDAAGITNFDLLHFDTAKVLRTLQENRELFYRVVGLLLENGSVSSAELLVNA